MIDSASSTLFPVGPTLSLPSTVAPTPTRPCAGPCGTFLSQARLRAMPSARLCVPCLEQAGDVPVLKRYDDAGVDGEVHQSFFTNNKAIETEMHRRNRAAESSVRLIDTDLLEPGALSPEKYSIKVTALPS